jgi:hypothetical protein
MLFGLGQGLWVVYVPQGPGFDHLALQKTQETTPKTKPTPLD